MGKFIDRTGRRYGRLVATRYLGDQTWECVCDCGATAQVKAGSLHSGNTKSCGCRKRTVLGESTTKHGMTGSRVYRIWKAMRGRCNNPNHPRYADYGGRGIQVCERWSLFINFLADMGEPPEGASIDRIDNNGNYEPGNCRWVTPSAQNTNRRNSIVVDGVPLRDLARQYGVSYHTLYDRYANGRPLKPAE